MELEKRLNELQDLIYRKNSLEKKLEENKTVSIYLKEKKKELAYKLEMVDINPRKIENKSIIYLWYDLFTSKGKKVTKTEHDYKIFFDLCELINSEIIELKQKLSKIQEYEEEYNQLKQEKAALILENEVEKYEKLSSLSLESSKYKNRIRDINDAINAGNNLNITLKYLLDLLKKSKSWDTFDIFGQGLFMTITKTSIFKHTEDKIKNLHYLTNKFAREVKVVNYYMNLNIDFSSITKLGDYYINELYYDIADKKRILNTIEYINQSHETANKMINYLSSYKENYLKDLIKIEEEKHKIINS